MNSDTQVAHANVLYDTYRWVLMTTFQHSPFSSLEIKACLYSTEPAHHSQIGSLFNLFLHDYLA